MEHEIYEQAGETFASAGKIHSLPNAANIVLAVVQGPGPEGRGPAIAKVEELAQLWSLMAGGWHNTILQVRRLCSGSAMRDTQSFADAMTLTASLLRMAYWAAYRLVTVVGQIGGDEHVAVTPKQHERNRWNTFREKANTILADFDALVREANIALGLGLTPLDERITDPW